MHPRKSHSYKYLGDFLNLCIEGVSISAKFREVKGQGHFHKKPAPILPPPSRKSYAFLGQCVQARTF